MASTLFPLHLTSQRCCRSDQLPLRATGDQGKRTITSSTIWISLCWKHLGWCSFKAERLRIMSFKVRDSVRDGLSVLDVKLLSEEEDFGDRSARSQFMRAKEQETERVCVCVLCP